MELNHLPVIDWELGTKLAGNKRDLAEDMLSMLIVNLKQEIVVIKHLWHDKNYPSLLNNIHKLHGAVCYVGTPRLKLVIGRLETDLKSNIMDSLPSLLEQLQIEVNLLIDGYESHQSYAD